MEMERYSAIENAIRSGDVVDLTLDEEITVGRVILIGGEETFVFVRTVENLL